MTVYITKEDIESIFSFLYCPECGEVWNGDEDHQDNGCNGELKVVYGFFEGGSVHSPVIFDEYVLFLLNKKKEENNEL